MDCTEFKELLSDYENLTAAKKQLFEEHSKECNNCAEELEQYLSMLQTLKSLPKLTAPKDFLTDLNYRIDKEDIKQQTRVNLAASLKRYSYRYGAAVACLALIAVIGINNTELVDRMNGEDDGVISVVTSTIEPSSKPEKTAIAVISSPEVKPTASAAVASPSATKAPTGKSQSTKVPSTKAPVSDANNTKSTVRPLATPIPQPVRPTLSPTVVPEVSSTANSYDVIYSISDEPEATAVVEVTTPVEVTEAPADNANIATASMIGNEQGGLVLNPDEYQLPENVKTRIADNSEDINGYTASSNSIEVSYASADKAKEIISEYSISNDGEYYSVSSDKMEEFLQAMSDAGVEYAENCVEVGADTITFRLIIS